MTNDDALVEAMRFAAINEPMAEGVSFRDMMVRISQAMGIPWNEAAFKEQTGRMFCAALSAYRQHTDDTRAAFERESG